MSDKDDESTKKSKKSFEKMSFSEICSDPPFEMPKKCLDIGQYIVMPAERDENHQARKTKRTARDAAFVRQCKRAGFTDTVIAKRLDIDERVLRDLYRKELDYAALDIEQALSESILFRALHADDPKVAQKAAEFYLTMRRGWKKDSLEESAAVVLQVAERLQQAKEARSLALEKMSDIHKAKSADDE